MTTCDCLLNVMRELVFPSQFILQDQKGRNDVLSHVFHSRFKHKYWGSGRPAGESSCQRSLEVINGEELDDVLMSERQEVGRKKQVPQVYGMGY